MSARDRTLFEDSMLPFRLLGVFCRSASIDSTAVLRQLENNPCTLGSKAESQIPYLTVLHQHIWIKGCI